MHMLKNSLLLKLLIQWLLLASSFLSSAVLAVEEEQSNPKPSCSSSCGGLEIPYPFGVGKGCFMKGFEIKCTHNPPRATLRDTGYEVVDISVGENQLRIKNSLNVTLVHIEELNGDDNADASYSINLTHTPFAVSYKNRFTVTGCNSLGLIILGEARNISFACAPSCVTDSNFIDNTNESCFGYGFCHAPIFRGVKIVGAEVKYRFSNESTVKELYNISKISASYRCASAFLTDQKEFSYSNGSDHLDVCFSPQESNSTVVLEWAVNNGQTCQNAQKNLADYACKGNSSCDDYKTEEGQGYRCICNKGYQGNPYLDDDHGCQDIDECKLDNTCGPNQKCVNTPGKYHCKRLPNTTPLPIVLSFIALLFLLALVASVYFFLKRRKLIKLREKFFRENGGLLLQQQDPLRQSAVKTTKIFSSSELLKATDHYSESRIIGQGGNGTVYKGIIGNNNQIVAIKKSKIEAKSQIEQFINEVVVASQINHRNVVRLLGCCLETEVPLLVFEFVSNGSLHHQIHHSKMVGSLSWDIRLRIATETASAIAYLHSAASVPIIHRDIKSANILLDEQFVAKVSDFGASKFIPIDQTQVTTLVQGTFGYLDPQYFQTTQLTQKSDVYSYGVVLVELLTGEMPVSFTRPEPHRNLSSYFILSMQQGRLSEILKPGLANDENREELKAVADIAMRCLMLKGEDRPLMREVLTELLELRELEKHPRGQAKYEVASSLLNQQTESYQSQSSSTSIYSSSMPTEMALSLAHPR